MKLRWFTSPGSQNVPAPQSSPISQRQARFFTISGISMILGSISLLLVAIFALIANTSGRNLTLAVLVAYLATGIFYILGLPGLYKKQAGKAGLIGLAGLIIVMIALLYSDFVTSLEIILLQEVHPVVAPWQSQVIAYYTFVYNFVLLFPGNLLFAVGIIRASLYPRWVGIVIIGVAFVGIVTVLVLTSTATTLMEIMSDIFLAFAYIRCASILLHR
ncbi:MAG TPA: hypothetical protein VL485_11965 [Ktedonobacteraceae bacterium]|jgi:hypothetical protein|nr:hypothetical protein [Ktedonobacteraceae bacterium]